MRRESGQEQASSLEKRRHPEQCGGNGPRNARAGGRVFRAVPHDGEC